MCTQCMIPSVLFNDKRVTATILMVWLVAIIIIFSSLGVWRSTFFRFGPSPSLHFMTIAIDTAEEWTMLALYCFVDTLIKTFGLIVMEVYYAYVHVSGMFKFFLSLTQFDFVLINMCADLAMKIFSYNSYMEHKAYVSPPSGDPDSQALMMLPVDENGKLRDTDEAQAV